MSSEPVVAAPALASHLATAGMATIFLSLFGGLWMVLALNSESWIWLVACVLIPASLLLMRGIGLMISGQQARGTAVAAAEERTIRVAASRRIGWIILVDFGAMAVAANILYSAHLAAWTVATMAGIIAVQFLVWPLLLGDALYYFPAGAELIAVAAVAAFFRGRIRLADPLFGLVIGLTLWLTVVFLLLRASRIVSLLTQAAEEAAASH
ncbi:MAG: hypothetical protein ACRD1F_11170 [Terriglobales bacterium]